MNFGKQAFAYLNTSRFGSMILPTALAAVAVFPTGCMESSPGGSQGESQSPPLVLRVTSANPLCKPPTYLLVLDEDAIRNPSQCASTSDRDCDRGDGKDNDKDKEKDTDKDKDDGKCKKDDRGSERYHDASRQNCDKDKAGDKGDKGGSGAQLICHKNHVHTKECYRDDGDGGKHKHSTLICKKVHTHTRECYKDDDDGNTGGKDGAESQLICHKNHVHTKECYKDSRTDKDKDRDEDHEKSGDGKEVKRNEIDADQTACEKSEIGKRTTLKFFADNVGREIVLPAGSLGDEGWFAVTAIRVAWKSAGPEAGDGLRNYEVAGPGLGKPDAKGNKETLLDNVPDLTPLRAIGLDRLVGASVCGIVLDGDVKMTYGPSRSGNIQGPNLGIVGFQVLGTEATNKGSATQLPGVRVRILDADAVCSDPLAAFTNAPAPTSASQPPDVDRPSCSVQKTLLSETWDNFDSTMWRGDGSQVVENGFFHAQDGSASATADYIVPCPIPVESTSAVRFTNRLQLTSPDQAAYAQSGALFFVNADNDNSFNNYVFINVGYTMAPSKVFVELFGSDNGQDFDQFEETSLAFTPSQLFNVDLWIQPNSYQIAVGEQIIDTVRLAAPIPGVSLFEVGVQQNESGLRGLVDMTTIAKICEKEKEAVHHCRAHSIHRNMRKERMGKTCRNRNSYIRLAKERIKHCAHPSQAMRVLSKMKETPE